MIPFFFVLVSLTAPARDTLAAALVAEGATLDGGAAMLYVLRKRARVQGRTLPDMARKYCEAWKHRRPRPRALEMRRLALRPGPWSSYYGRFQRARALVVRWEQGRVADPCRGRAWHWAAPSRRPRGRMRAIRCGRTRNRFYTLAPRA